MFRPSVQEWAWIGRVEGAGRGVLFDGEETWYQVCVDADGIGTGGEHKVEGCSR